VYQMRLKRRSQLTALGGGRGRQSRDDCPQARRRCEPQRGAPGHIHCWDVSYRWPWPGDPL